MHKPGLSVAVAGRSLCRTKYRRYHRLGHGIGLKVAHRAPGIDDIQKGIARLIHI
jgi:hypothetical protein